MEIRKMIVLNNVQYESWYELCQAYNISYAELIKFRINNKNTDTLEILEHFIGNVGYCMSDGRYVTFEKDSSKLNAPLYKKVHTHFQGGCKKHRYAPFTKIKVIPPKKELSASHVK